MPKRAVEGEARLRSLNMKTTEALRAKLEAAALRSGRALSHEVEMRLERSVQRDEHNGGEHTSALLEYLAGRIRLVEESHGRTPWIDSPEVSMACRVAVDKALDGVFPETSQHELWYSACVHAVFSRYLGKNTLKMADVHEIDQSLVNINSGRGEPEQKQELQCAGEKAKKDIDRLIEGMHKLWDGDVAQDGDRLTFERWLEATT